MLRYLLMIAYVLALAGAALSIFLPWFPLTSNRGAILGVPPGWAMLIFAMAMTGCGLAIMGPVDRLSDWTRHGVISRLFMAGFGLLIVVLAVAAFEVTSAELRHDAAARGIVVSRNRASYGFEVALAAGGLAALCGFFTDWSGTAFMSDEELEERMSRRGRRLTQHPVVAPPDAARIEPTAVPINGTGVMPQPTGRLLTPAQTVSAGFGPAVDVVTSGRAITPLIASREGLEAACRLGNLSPSEFAATRTFHLARQQEEEILHLVERRLKALKDSLSAGTMTSAEYEAKVASFHNAVVKAATDGRIVQREPLPTTATRSRLRTWGRAMRIALLPNRFA